MKIAVAFFTLLSKLARQQQSAGHFCRHNGAKSFSYEKDLKRHIRAVHEGRKDHKCSSCQKSFTQVANLKKHITQFTKITNVIHVINYLLKKLPLHVIQQQFRKVTNRNVIHVVNYLLRQAL